MFLKFSFKGVWSEVLAGRSLSIGKKEWSGSEFQCEERRTRSSLESVVFAPGIGVLLAQ
jgi:hypothetical protein